MGSVVPVETHSLVEEHPGVALSTNLPVKLQPRKNRARSSVVLCPGDAATQDPLTASAGSAARIFYPVPLDVLLLCWTLVSDKAVPSGYEMEFAALETSIQKASDSALRLSTRMNNMTSAVWLHQREEMLNSSSSSEEVVRGPVSARSPVSSNALQGEVAAAFLRWSQRPPGRRRGSQKQVGGDSGFSPERHIDTHGRTSEQGSRQPQTPRGRQTSNNPQSDRTHSEEVSRLAGFGTRGDVSI